MVRSDNLSKWLTRDRLSTLAVALAPLVYFYPATLGKLVISPDDGVLFNVPLRATAANILLSGNLPLWNPYIFGGMPLHGAAQGALLFPPNWLYLVFSVPTATNLMMLVTYAFAAVGAYLFARRIGCSVMGAVVTSLAWQWSAFLICHIGHTSMVQSASTLPWVLWAVDGYGATGLRRRGVLLAALVALQCFAGHQQTFAYSLLLAAAYAAVMARSSIENRSNYLRSLVFLGGGLLLSAVQLLPTLELLRYSARAEASYDFFTSFSMPRLFVLTLFAPFLLGGADGGMFSAAYVGPPYFGEFAAYVGSATLMLAVVAVTLKRDVRTRFFAIVAAVCLLLALGRYAPLGLYKLFYYVPILNLFRVPARHLMEVQFALAVLAGRGLTAISLSRGAHRTTTRAALVGTCVFLLTVVVVSWWRPDDFKLGRQAASVSVLRAPELFLPIAVAGASAWALWMFARRKRVIGAVLLFLILALDLIVWGHSSGWRSSSQERNFEMWGEPETVRYLRENQRGEDTAPFRILTADYHFDPDVSVQSLPAGALWLPALQADLYMMHGIENAAGYDGFGLARYSRLAGDMKIWGELSNPERVLRGSSRELDLLNVRYLLTRPLAEVVQNAKPSSGSSSRTARVFSDAELAAPSSLDPDASSTPVPQDFPAATHTLGGFAFAAEDLNLPSLGGGAQLSLVTPPVEANRFALVTSLGWSVDVPNGASVAHVRLRAEDGRVFNFELRAGHETSEWAFDRSDIRARIKHGRAPVANGYTVEDKDERYEAHAYIASFALPERVTITGGEITIERVSQAPDLVLSVLRISLIDEAAGNAFPIRREWLSTQSAKESAKRETPAPVPPSMKKAATVRETATQDRGRELSLAEGPRWRRLARLGKVSIYENARQLPRAWLATDAAVVNEHEMLNAIRTGNLPDGTEWDPLSTALIEGQIDFKPNGTHDPARRAQVTKYAAGTITINTASTVPSMLVLSENYFPGWQAYVDGAATTIFRVDYNLRGVVLPSGAHLVEFVYRPKSVIVGFAVSLVTLVGLLTWALVNRGGI